MKKREKENKNVVLVYVVQAEFETSLEAESEAKTFASQKPDIEDYIDTEGNHILIRCSSKEKADAMTRMLNKRLDPVSVEIFTEEIESQSESSFVSKSIVIKLRWRDCYKFWISGVISWMVLVLIVVAIFYAFGLFSGLGSGEFGTTP